MAWVVVGLAIISGVKYASENGFITVGMAGKEPLTLEDLQTQLNQYRAEQTELSTELAGKQTELKKLTKTDSDIGGDINSLNKQKSSLVAEINKIKADRNKIKNNPKKKSQYDALTKQLNSKNSQLSRVKTSLSNKDVSLKANSRSINSVNGQIASITQQQANLDISIANTLAAISALKSQPIAPQEPLRQVGGILIEVPYGPDGLPFPGGIPDPGVPDIGGLPPASFPADGFPTSAPRQSYDPEADENMKEPCTKQPAHIRVPCKWINEDPFIPGARLGMQCRGGFIDFKTLVNSDLWESGHECEYSEAGMESGYAICCFQKPYCGDGKVEPGEECDDGNTCDNDGCTKGCKNTCPKGSEFSLTSCQLPSQGLMTGFAGETGECPQQCYTCKDKCPEGRHYCPSGAGVESNNCCPEGKICKLGEVAGAKVKACVAPCEEKQEYCPGVEGVGALPSGCCQEGRKCKSLPNGKKSCQIKCPEGREECEGAPNTIWAGQEGMPDCCDKDQRCQSFTWAIGATILAKGPLCESGCSNKELKYLYGAKGMSPYEGEDTIDGKSYKGELFQDACYRCEKTGEYFCNHPSGKKVKVKDCSKCTKGPNPPTKRIFDDKPVVFTGGEVEIFRKSSGDETYIVGDQGSQIFRKGDDVYAFDSDSKNWYQLVDNEFEVLSPVDAQKVADKIRILSKNP